MTDPVNPLDMKPDEVEYWSTVQAAKFKQLYMTAKEVEETYKISMSRQTQLIKAKRVIVVKDAQRVYYERDYAHWWFSAYVAQQTAKVSTREAKKSGRPKKDPEAWRHTVFEGYAIDIDPKFSTAKKWLEWQHIETMKCFEVGSEGHKNWLETKKRLSAHFNIKSEFV